LITKFTPARPLPALGACALALMLLAGCHNDSKTADGAQTPSTSPGGGAGQTQLAFVANNASDYWKICQGGTKAAQKELGSGVSVQFITPADGSAATQKSDVDDLLSKGVKGIAISPVDPANETPYLNTVAAKASLITSDSDAPTSNRLCYIGTDNHAAGLMAGNLLKEALPQGGKVMIYVGKSDAQNAADRISGVRDAVKGSKIQILDVRTDDTDRARAKQNALDTLTNTPDIAGMVGIWSYNGGQIANAIRQSGKVGKVKVIAFDQEADTMAGVKDGTIYGAVVQDPYAFGYRSIKLLAALAKGDKSGIPANKVILVPTQAVKGDKIDAYLAGLKKEMGS